MVKIGTIYYFNKFKKMVSEAFKIDFDYFEYNKNL